jgi:hypothetical protein
MDVLKIGTPSPKQRLLLTPKTLPVQIGRRSIFFIFYYCDALFHLTFVLGNTCSSLIPFPGHSDNPLPLKIYHYCSVSLPFSSDSSPSPTTPWRQLCIWLQQFAPHYVPKLGQTWKMLSPLHLGAGRGWVSIVQLILSHERKELNSVAGESQVTPLLRAGFYTLTKRKSVHSAECYNNSSR